MHIHLFELEDLPWLPVFLRQGLTDFLRYFQKFINYYSPVPELLEYVIKKSETQRIIDTCSGGGGAIENIYQTLIKRNNTEIKIILSDLYPNIDSFEYIKQKTMGKIDYISYSINALKFPKELIGLRTMFSALHHFKYEEVKIIMEQAVSDNQPVAFFDVGEKHIFSLIGITLIQPIFFLILTPFIRPFKFWRLIFTYLIPLIPICTTWDGFVTILRLYKPKDLQKIISEINSEKYYFETGLLKNKLGLRVTFLIGYPKIK